MKLRQKLMYKYIVKFVCVKECYSSEHSGLETLPMNDKITRKGGEKEKIVRKR